LPEVRERPFPEGGAQSYDGEAIVIGFFASDLNSSTASVPAAGEGASSASPSAALTSYELSERANHLLGHDLAQIVKELAKETELKLKTASSATTHLLSLGDSNRLRVRRVAVYCLGKEEEFSAEVLNKFGSFVSSNVRNHTSQPDRVGVVVTWPSHAQSLPAELFSQRLTESILLSAFTDDRFRSSDDEDGASKSETSKRSRAVIDILGADELGVRRGHAVANGVMLTRELVNAPPNVATPQFFAETAQHLAEEAGGSLQCTILEKEDCERLGMGAFLGVAQGSELPPKFIHMKFTSPSATPGKSRKHVCLVGKGITHDTGGYNLKTAGSMIELMKFDCGGAAACFGTMKAIMALEPPDLELSVITACCENMISGKAYHPGDILTASNGKTIEVLNTDAEGRLTLADALLYAQQNIPDLDALVDIATLTGACIVALGTEYSGMWTAQDDLAAKLESAAKQVGERLWRMPLAAEYREGLKGKISDLKNITGGRWGGAIIAALFLQEFVKKEIPWAHLDIAGTVWNEKQSMATGVPTRTLVEFVESIARS
jgi:leucyl aminopeptidase